MIGNPFPDENKSEDMDTSVHDETKANKKPKLSKNLIKRLKWKKRREKKLYSRKVREIRKQLREQVKNQTPSLDSSCSTRDKALSYLHQWAEDRESWKFQKIQQSWLLKNVFDENLICQEDFRILKRYFRKLTGLAREKLMIDCQKVIDNGDLQIEQTEQFEDVEIHPDDSRNKQCAKKRAKRLLKILSKSAVDD